MGLQETIAADHMEVDREETPSILGHPALEEHFPDEALSQLGQLALTELPVDSQVSGSAPAHTALSGPSQLDAWWSPFSGGTAPKGLQAHLSKLGSSPTIQPQPIGPPADVAALLQLARVSKTM